MTPVEVTAFGLLAVCVILLSIVLAAQVVASRPLPATVRTVMLLVLLIEPAATAS